MDPETGDAFNEVITGDGGGAMMDTFQNGVDAFNSAVGSEGGIEAAGESFMDTMTTALDGGAVEGFSGEMFQDMADGVMDAVDFGAMPDGATFADMGPMIMDAVGDIMPDGFEMPPQMAEAMGEMFEAMGDAMGDAGYDMGDMADAAGDYGPGGEGDHDHPEGEPGGAAGGTGGAETAAGGTGGAAGGTGGAETAAGGTGGAAGGTGGAETAAGGTGGAAGEGGGFGNVDFSDASGADHDHAEGEQGGFAGDQGGFAGDQGGGGGEAGTLAGALGDTPEDDVQIDAGDAAITAVLDGTTDQGGAPASDSNAQVDPALDPAIVDDVQDQDDVDDPADDGGGLT